MAIVSLLAKLGLDWTDFRTNVKRAESLMDRFGKNVLGSVQGQLASAFSVGAVTAFAHSVIEAADRVGDLSDQMSLSVEDVQKLDIAASRSGVQVEQLGQAFLKVGEYRRKAGEGDYDAVQMLEKMGVSLQDIQNRSLSNKDIAQKVFDWYLKTNKTAKDQADVVDVVGLKAEKLVAAFKALQDLGPVKLFSKEDIDAISQFNDGIAEMKRNLQVAAAPAVSWWAGVMKQRNETEQKPDTKFYHMSMIGAIAAAFAGDADGAKTQGATKEEVKAASEALKAQKAESKTDLFEPVLSGSSPSTRGNNPSLAGGPLRSIGGILFDRFDDGSMARQAVKLSERTATATERTASVLEKVTNR